MIEVYRRNGQLLLRYSTEEYPFLPWAKAALDAQDLSKLHERVDSTIESSWLVAMESYRKELASSFVNCRSLFRRFFETEVAPIFETRNTMYQIPPVFRVHLDGGLTASAFHRDRDHGVPSDRLNLWLPLTKVWDSNSLWVEEGNLMVPIEAEYGEAIIFDGPNVLHGSVENRTGATRVSLDSRFLPLNRSAFCEQGSLHQTAKSVR